MPPKKMIYQFKVTLKDTKPHIWRRIQVPNTYTFWDLHVAIQDAMGWTDSHLHEFTVKNPLSINELYFGIPDEESDFDLDKTTLPGWKHKISKYISLLNPAFEYVYDFGDDWRHKVELEEVLPAEKDVVRLRCLKGKRACPPEDCGGPWGYQRLLEILADPEHEEYESSKEWIESMKEGPFDPEHFDPQAVEFSDPKERLEMAFSDM
jgi:hypothetical protein